MKLKETRQLSQVALDDVVEGSRMIFSSTVQRLHSGVRAKLASLGMDETKLDDLFSDVTDPFVDLQTRYKQEKFFKEQFGLVVSKHGILLLHGTQEFKLLFKYRIAGFYYLYVYGYRALLEK